MDCVNDIFVIVVKDVVVNGEFDVYFVLQNRVVDVVCMVFLVFMLSVFELWIWGMKIIGVVLWMFGKFLDFDFEEVMFLEQYQVQISFVLILVFVVDLFFEFVFEVVNVCVSFIVIGIVIDVEWMGRIFKILVSVFESFFKEDENVGIGDFKGLSFNVQVMVKIFVFLVWVELQVVSIE